MLTRHDNETLTRTDQGTPMGDVMRRYWIPALLASELTGPDCPPVRVKLLGEQLVAGATARGHSRARGRLKPPVSRPPAGGATGFARALSD